MNSPDLNRQPAEPFHPPGADAPAARSAPQSEPSQRWWRGITRYQWLVLSIASAGWIFDVFEGQIFNLTRGQMLRDLLGPAATAADVNRWGEIFLGVFLA